MTDWKRIETAPTNRPIKARNLGGEEKIITWKGDDKSGNWATKGDTNEQQGGTFNPIEWKEAPPEPKTSPFGVIKG